MTRMTHTSVRRGSLTRTLLLLLTTLSVFAALAISPFAPKADAAPVSGLFSIEMKTNPSAFTSGKSVDIPIYLVENRDARNGVSWFKEYPLGVRSVAFDISSGQSQILKFTPAKQFDYRKEPTSVFDKARYRNTVGTDADGLSHLWATLWSSQGARAHVDNTGINGRTEILLGTMKVKIGTAIKKGDRKLVLEMITIADPSSYSGFDFWTKLPATSGDVSGGGTVGGNGLTGKHYKIYDDDPSTDEHAKTKKKTSTTIELAKKKVKKGKVAKVTVTVKPKKAAGQATVYAGKKALKTVIIDKGTVAVITVPTSKLSVGKHSITVKFSPVGKKFAASKSAAVTLTVKKPAKK